ncbi:hypothetical protein [Micromonospora sp. NBC_01813]|uniref:hypothetical protein n=1 Tax=Micromonospora sp. NBC_01813 TaxID=2975988 RepID=UPI003FA3AD57
MAHRTTPLTAARQKSDFEICCRVQAALDRAERAFDRADNTSNPQWIGYFDEANLSAKFGHCFAALG